MHPMHLRSEIINAKNTTGVVADLHEGREDKSLLHSLQELVMFL
jgi:hypothetical protein